MENGSAAPCLRMRHTTLRTDLHIFATTIYKTPLRPLRALCEQNSISYRQACIGEIQLKNSSVPSACPVRDKDNPPLRALCEQNSISYRQAFIGEIQLKNSSAPSASSARDDENPRKKQQMYVTMCDMDERSIAYVDIDEYPIKSSPSRGTT